MSELYLDESAQAGETEHLYKQASALELALLVCQTAQGGTSDPRLGWLRVAARARSLAHNDKKAAVTSSAAQLELSERLRAAGWEHADEACLEGGLLVVDMACTATRVVVEFDGPSHFLSHVQSGEESYDGSSLLKTKLLEALGWRVHRVGWRAWARDRDAEVARVAAALLPAAWRR
jgi:very-short-patch-repair endonuclease